MFIHKKKKRYKTCHIKTGARNRGVQVEREREADKIVIMQGYVDTNYY